MATKHSALLSASALFELRSNPNLRIVDASWHMPDSGKNAKREYVDSHIQDAVFFDLDESSDTQSPYPHMLPSPRKFAETMSRLGIRNDSQLVAYDSVGLFSAARLWWMLRVFGHTDVRVLDGGLPTWLKAGYSIVSGDTVTEKSPAFLIDYQPHLIASKLDVVEWSESQQVQICDARSPDRFFGREPEPRAGVRSGHIPHAKNIHYRTLLNADGTMKSRSELEAIFASQSVDITKPIATSCGSGVTACIIALALYELGYDDIPVYDGSWSEWGASDLPLAL